MATTPARCLAVLLGVAIAAAGWAFAGGEDATPAAQGRTLSAALRPSHFDLPNLLVGDAAAASGQPFSAESSVAWLDAAVAGHSCSADALRSTSLSEAVEAVLGVSR